MVFCNIKTGSSTKHKKKVTILILIDGFLQCEECDELQAAGIVTILILIDGFLQWV